ncbi:glycoside hydrolase family 18 protein [Paenibacillus sp. D51F]
MSNRNHVLGGYVGLSSLSLVTREDAGKLTHLFVAFGHVQNDEVVMPPWENTGVIAKLKRDNPELCILLSVGGWGAGGFSEAAATGEGRMRFAASAARIAVKYGFDGIDLDWEYPCYGQAGIASSPDDKANFTLLLKETRTALDRSGEAAGRRYLLTIAAGADQYYVDGTEMDKAHIYLDFVQLMTYDMRGGFQTLTGHHANLFTSTGDLFRISADASATIFMKAGVPPEKLVLGAAFYSRMWKGVPDRNDGYLQMAASSGGYGPDYTALESDYIGKNGFIRHWDDEAKAPYLFDGSTFISYEDAESLQNKARYVKEKGLAGIMFWEYSCDRTHRLLDTLYRMLAADPMKGRL